MRLDGSTPANSRHHVVNRFNDDPSIDLLLLTTTVGGLGLNLTGADTVIFVEHDWNPMKDLQVTVYLCGTTFISTKLQEWPLYMIFASIYADLDNGLTIRIIYWYGSRFSLHTICRFFFFSYWFWQISTPVRCSHHSLGNGSSTQNRTDQGSECVPTHN